MVGIHGVHNTLEDILTNFEAITESGCWIWLGATSKRGYGLVRFEDKQHYAHKLFYEICRGPVPDGMELDHTCRVKCCVRLDHLDPVYHLENTRRAGVFIRKISHPDIKAIRESTERAAIVARKFGISTGYVRMLRIGNG